MRQLKGDWILGTLTSSIDYPIDEFIAEGSLRKWALIGGNGSLKM
jgi:hypothetical protein